MSGHDFCRAMLRMTMADVRKHTTAAQRKAAWAWRSGRQHIEFHGPGDFYWYANGCCLYEAKARGWSAWLGKNVEGFEAAS